MRDDLLKKLKVIKQLVSDVEKTLSVMGSQKYTPMEISPVVLDMAKQFGDRPFTLEELRFLIPDEEEVSNKLAGSTLVHNGYRKRQRTHKGVRRWVYVRDAFATRYGEIESESATAEPQSIEDYVMLSLAETGSPPYFIDEITIRFPELHNVSEDRVRQILLNNNFMAVRCGRNGKSATGYYPVVE